MLIGEIEGTVTTSGFKFRVYSDIKKFDFVTVKKDDLWILSQVHEVFKHEDGKIEAETAIIGYREKGLLKKPRQVIKPNSMVYLADEEIIAETLGLAKKGLYMGKLESNAHVKIHLDVETLYRHLAILAQTGAGKSYLTSVVIEELLEKGMPVIIIDPHGEYSSLNIKNHINDSEKNKFEIEPKSFKTNEYSIDVETNQNSKKLSFSDKDLDPNEIDQMLPTSLSNAQLGMLYTSVKDMPKGYSLQDLIRACMSSDSKAKWSLVNMLEVLYKSGLFSENPVNLKELVRPGMASIINMRGVEPDIQEAIVYKLSKELFSMRKKDQIGSMILVLEEAHNYLPERNIGKAICSGVLRTIASEGRKFGFGLIVVSQRPARIDNNILSQCNSQIIMRLTNPSDLNTVSKSFEGITASVKSTISGLPAGIGVILGKEYPIITEIRTRKSLHGGDTNRLTEKTRRGVEKMEQIKLISPSVPKDKLSKSLKEVYYPLWVLSDESGFVVIDGKNGKMKYVRPEMTKSENLVFEAIKVGNRSREELIEKLGINLPDLNSSLEGLVKKNFVDVDRKNKHLLFSLKNNPYESRVISIEPGTAKIVNLGITAEEAKKVGGKYLKDKERIELIYYPYYASGNKVYDGITGKEV